MCTPNDPGRALRCARTALRPRARCALGVVSWHTGRRVVAPLRPCHSVHWSCRRSCRALCSASCRRPLGHNTKFVSQHNSLSHALRAVSRMLQRVSQRYCVVSLGARRHIVALGALCRDTRPSSYHDTNDCIATHPSGQAARTHATARPAPRPTVS